tara:strand:- start:12720 stop:15395 length:2676 start_codon:yes stop_codon:yes gene_type:complete
MASKYPEIDILPKSGIDLRDPSETDWFANLWRPDRSNNIQIRPGFGQLEQLDSTTMNAWQGAVTGSGGYTRHLGSFFYRGNFGHKQVLSVFEADIQVSNGTAPTTSPLNGLRAIEGNLASVVVSIYDIDTGYQWEEVLTVHTSEFTTNTTIPEAHNHFESANQITNPLIPDPNLPMDYIGVHFDKETEDACFAQVGDSVVLCLGAYGVWVYHGIDVAATRVAKISVDNFRPVQMKAGAFVGVNNQQGYSEGSVIRPVAGTRGLNGTNFVYLNKSEFPRATCAVLSKNRVVYAQRSVLYFSDVGQPGAIMADNFAEFQTEGEIVALGQFNNNIYALTETEAHYVAFNHRVAAGPAMANVVDVHHVKLSDRAGCVGPRAICTTPFGVAWVSSRGCHIAGADQAVKDISDAIMPYWGDGIVDPMSQYFPANGSGGAKAQPSVIYKHEGKPTLSYEPESESLLVAYPSHILVYQFRQQSWSIWPLAANNRTTEVYSRQTVEALQIMSDASGVYLAGGLFDSDENGLNPATQTSSYYLCKLGLGGATDRSCQTEDHRHYGYGQFNYSIPSGGGGSWSLNNPVCVYVNPPKVINSADFSKKIYEITIDVESMAAWPAAGGASGAFDLTFTYDSNFTLEGSAATMHSRPYSAFTFTPGVNQLRIQRAALNTANRSQVGRIPFVVLRLTADANADYNPNLAFSGALVWDATAGAYAAVPCLVYNFTHKYAATSRNTGNRLQTAVEWGYQTGQIGMNEGQQLKARALNVTLESSTKATSNIYNAIFSGDYKIRSGQYPDYNSPTLATRRYQSLQTIRERMLNNRRVFDSVAKWAPVTTAADKYLIDSPELNSLVLSAHARGASIKAGIYGWCEDKADKLKLHRLSLGVFAVGGRRRKGRT